MIYDCFLFFNEFEVLDIRLNELDPVVDKFVLVECTQNHRGKEKQLFFGNYLVSSNRNGYPDIHKFLDKIVYVLADTPPKININDGRPRTRHTMDWSIENYQRNAIMEGLKDCKDDDIIMISDVDEIPRKEVLQNINEVLFTNDSWFYTCVQRMYYYYLNTYCMDSWGGTNIVDYKKLRSSDPQSFRNRRKHGRRLRVRTVSDLTRGDGGGWHFSYMGGVDKIQEKISSFAHWEVDIDSVNNEQYLKECMDELKMFHRYNRGRPQMFMEDMAFLPEYVQKNKEQFKEFLK